MSSEANREAQKRYRDRLKNRTDEELRAAQDAKPYKRCTKCKRTLLSRENFIELRSRPDGFHSECRSCGAARTKKWVEDNPDKAREYWKEYQRRPEVKERKRRRERHAD